MTKESKAGLVFMLVFMLAVVFYANLVSAQLDSYGTKTLNEQFSFCQGCADATYITLSSIETPNSTLQIDSNMTPTGSKQWCYNYTPNQIGRHDLRGISDGCTGEFTTYIEVTKYGVQNYLFIPLVLLVFLLSLVGILVYIRSSSNFDYEKLQLKCEKLYESGAPVKGFIYSTLYSFREHYLIWSIGLGVIPVWCLNELIFISGFTGLINVFDIMFNLYFVLIFASTLYWFDSLIKFVKKMAKDVEGISRGSKW